MATTDLVSASLAEWMDKAFNDPANPPAGGLSGGVQLRPGMGLPALDGFGECSLAWIMSGIRGKTESFPALADHAGCGGRSIVEFSVGIARCSQALGKNGRLPSLSQMESEYAVQEQDKDLLAWATCSAARQLETSQAAGNFALLPIEVYGPSGGTVAVYRTVMIELGRHRA